MLSAALRTLLCLQALLILWDLVYLTVVARRDNGPCIITCSESTSLLGCQSANALVSAALTRGRWPISAQNPSRDYWHKMAHVNLRGQYGPSFYSLVSPVFLTLAPPSLQLPILRAQTFVHKWRKVACVSGLIISTGSCQSARSSRSPQRTVCKVL